MTEPNNNHEANGTNGRAKRGRPKKTGDDPAGLHAQPTAGLAEVITSLRKAQRQRVVVLKSRNMMANRLQAVVAGTLGYSAGMTEKERRAKFAEASAVIKGVCAGTSDHPWKSIIITSQEGIDGLNRLKEQYEKEMEDLAATLPIFKSWCRLPEQRGFGSPLFLAIVIGECGDLSEYQNPGKLWKRMGCAPHTFEGKTLMGSTWKAGREGKLTAEQWAAYGYCPRRRSISYLIGESMMKLNILVNQDGEKVPGPYRARYDQAKERAREQHPEWVECSKCKGAGGKCANCKGTGEVMKRCHLHAMLLATKLLLKRLWCEWNKGGLTWADAGEREAELATGGPR